MIHTIYYHYKYRNYLCIHNKKNHLLYNGQHLYYLKKHNLLFLHSFFQKKQNLFYILNIFYFLYIICNIVDILHLHLAHNYLYSLILVFPFFLYFGLFLFHNHNCIHLLLFQIFFLHNQTYHYIIHFQSTLNYNLDIINILHIH